MKKKYQRKVRLFLFPVVFHENLFCFYNKINDLLDKKVQNDKFPPHKIIKRTVKR